MSLALALLMETFIAAEAMASTDCENLLSLKLKQATLTTAQNVPAGAFTVPGTRNTVKVTAAFCRVALTLKPSPDSNILAEVWLPSSQWNGKFQGLGNGGFAGAINYPELAMAVSKGYAAASTDTGHQADAADAQWALNHPQKIVDFGYRAIHVMSDQAKYVIRTFYGYAAKRSYFNGCSDGGREALSEAQRFPADYDGIVAGAPANYWTHLLTQLVYNMAAIGAPESYIPAAKLRSIENNALDQCDALDGVKDGVIENPTACHLDLRPLLCKDGLNTNECLTQPQLDALAKIYAGPKTSSGKQVMPGLSPGGEAEPAGWAAWITGPRPQSSLQYAFGINFFKYMVYNDSSWDDRSSTVDRNLALADERLAGILNATDSDLTKFRARGGKLILYHGWADSAIPPLNTLDYYGALLSKDPRQAASFVRLFMVPGMQHCTSSGAGASMFVLNSVPLTDADHDVAAALERWVERGVAPDQIVVGKPRTMGNIYEFSQTRRLCAWPKTAHYTGSGSSADAANFLCQ